jgi:hypothetical protein
LANVLWFGAPYRDRRGLLDFHFEREPVLRHTAGGHPYTAWKPTNVPRIHDELLDCVVYLYRTRAEAERGESAGGSGFFCAYTSQVVPSAYFIFSVSNKHVVADAGASVIRINKHGGGVDIFELEPDQWFFTAQNDLAIVPIALDLEIHRVKALPLDDCLTKSAVESYDIGPGDEVFMIGRFIKHDGRLTNTPSVRFGNLSMMVDQIDHPTYGTQESFAVETRSMGGYSGSPVFVYPSPWNMNRGNIQIGNTKVFLLGIDWGHIVDHQEVRVCPERSYGIA